MRLFGRLFRLIWGADVEPALRPLLAVSFVGTATFSAGWSFVGIWAIQELGATSKQLGVAYLIAAVAGFAAGYLGGHASDYVGRRPMILLGWALLAATFLAYTFVGHHVWLGLGLASLAGIGGSIGGGADQAMVAFGSMGAVGFALGPFIGLQLRGAYGDGAAWYFFAAVSLVAAATGAAAVRGATRRRVAPATVGY